MDTLERSEPVLMKFKDFYDALDRLDYKEAQKVLDELQEVIGEDPELTSMQIQLDMDSL